MSWWRRAHRVTDGPLSCAEVAELLQQYLDDESDEATADRVAAHLEDCERCGVEADVYRDIKAALARRRAPLPEVSVRRLRRFGERIAAGDLPDTR
jgi:anti-sigma factor (TIGR02949 family)